MIAYGRIKERLQNLMDITADEYAVIIREAVMIAYREIASEHVWQTLLEEISFNGTVLPSDMDRPVLYVQDGSDYIYLPISESQRYLSQQHYNWYADGSVTTPLVTGNDGDTTINGTTFTSMSPSVAFNKASLDDLAGEYIQIGDNEGVYKIASVTDAYHLELERGFRGANLTNPSYPANLEGQYYEIRPRGTLKIAFTGEYGENITSTSRRIWYQRRPLPLYNDYDQIMLPGNCEAVRIKAFKLLLEGDKYDNDSLKQNEGYRQAIDRMQPLNPVRGRNPRPRDRFGNTIQFGRRRFGFATDANSRRIL